MPVMPQSQQRGQKRSHRNLGLFKTTNACSNANLTGVSTRTGVQGKPSAVWTTFGGFCRL